jgi:hypothetical protein
VPHFKLVGVLLPIHDSYGGNVNFFLKVWHIKVKKKLKDSEKRKNAWLSCIRNHFNSVPICDLSHHKISRFHRNTIYRAGPQMLGTESRLPFPNVKSKVMDISIQDWKRS